MFMVSGVSTYSGIDSALRHSGEWAIGESWHAVREGPESDSGPASEDGTCTSVRLVVLRCSCCGEDRPTLAGLQCHQDVKICSICVGWLKAHLGTMDVSSILPVLDMVTSVAFYEAAGFDVRVYRDELEAGEFAFVHYEDESVFDLGLESSAAGAGCFITVPSSDNWHERFIRLGYDVSLLRDEPWGLREFTLTDPSGNRLRFGHELG